MNLDDVNFKYLPPCPWKTYKEQNWTDCGDFLGTGRTYKKKFLSYKKAKKIVHTLNLNSQKEWKEYSKSGERPKNIPGCPQITYKNKGWISWGDFLGTKFVNYKYREYRSYKNSIKFVHRLKLKSRKEWHIYCKSGNKPNDIPNDPRYVYKTKGWKGWGDFLGTGYIHKKVFLSFITARKIVCLLDLGSFKEWQKYSSSGKRPDNIPSNPYEVYKNKGWRGMKDFLGTDK